MRNSSTAGAVSLPGKSRQIPATPQALTAALLVTARNLLAKIDNMTTDEFQLGGERQEREALRAIINTFDELAS